MGDKIGSGDKSNKFVKENTGELKWREREKESGGESNPDFFTIWNTFTLKLNSNALFLK